MSEKVKLRKTAICNGGVCQPGSIVRIPTRKAMMLIAAGDAEPVKIEAMRDKVAAARLLAKRAAKAEAKAEAAERTAKELRSAAKAARAAADSGAKAAGDAEPAADDSKKSKAKKD